MVPWFIQTSRDLSTALLARAQIFGPHFIAVAGGLKCFLFKNFVHNIVVEVIFDRAMPRTRRAASHAGDSEDTTLPPPPQPLGMPARRCKQVAPTNNRMLN